MKTIETEFISNELIKNIRKYRMPIDVGSDITCYTYDKDNVIKMFEITCANPEEKFFIPNSVYGNNTFIFENKIQRNVDNILLSYTQPFIRGDKLNAYVFNELEFDDLIIYIRQVLEDIKKISDEGIFAYDTFISNIILNDTGFHNIDTIDFKYLDKDPKKIMLDNLRVFFAIFWDYLMNDEMRKFCIANKLEEQFLYECPEIFFSLLIDKAKELSDKEITHIKHIKILAKRRHFDSINL